MALSMSNTICSSCGDDIKQGSKVTYIQNKRKNRKEPVCFRCHPTESETARLKINIYVRTGRLTSHRPNFVWK